MNRLYNALNHRILFYDNVRDKSVRNARCLKKGIDNFRSDQVSSLTDSFLLFLDEEGLQVLFHMVLIRFGRL